MGRVIQQLVAGRTDCTIAAGVDLFADSAAAFPAYTNIADVQEEADVIIDFSHPSLLTPILSYAAQKGGIPAVLCTTGYSAEQVEALKTAAQTQPVFYSRNMSLGINLLIELSKKAAKVLGDQFDIEIIEKHHNQKIDAPSGTALMLADAIASVRDGETQYVYDRHAQRKKREKARSACTPYAAARSSASTKSFSPATTRSSRSPTPRSRRSFSQPARSTRLSTCAARAPACTTCPI